MYLIYLEYVYHKNHTSIQEIIYEKVNGAVIVDELSNQPTEPDSLVPSFA